MVLIRIIIKVEVEMAIRGVVVEDLIILVLILGLIMVNPLVSPLAMQMVFFSFLDFNHNLSIRMVLVFLHFSLKVNLNLQDLLVKFVARLVILHWIAIIT